MIIIKKIFSLPINHIHRLLPNEANEILSNFKIVQLFTDGKSNDIVKEIIFNDIFCETPLAKLLKLKKDHTYILKHTSETIPETQSRLPEEINARHKLEFSPYRNLYVPTYATYQNTPPSKLPSLMLMKKAEGRTLTEMILDPTENQKTLTHFLPKYCHKFAEAFQKSPARKLHPGKERENFLRETTFLKIYERAQKKMKEKTLMGKAFQLAYQRETIHHQKVAYPNAYHLFDPNTQDKYLETVGICPKNWKKICEILKTVEVRISPSDITPVNFKIRTENNQLIAEFSYDQGRMEEHSYAYTLCKILGPFAELFWLKIANNKFKFENTPSASPLYPMDEKKERHQIKSTIRYLGEHSNLKIREDENSLETYIRQYNENVMNAFDQSPAHKDLLKSRPLFRPHLVFYSIRQLLADAPYRENAAQMSANIICASILMKETLQNLQNLCVTIENKTSTDSHDAFKTFINSPENWNWIKSKSESFFLKEVSSVIG